jgi:hypothetical protein
VCCICEIELGANYYFVFSEESQDGQGLLQKLCREKTIKGVQEKNIMHNAVTSTLSLVEMVEWNIFWHVLYAE